MGGDGNGRLRFGDFEFDSRSGKLLRHGWPVKIEPQPLRVLGVLLERPGEVVSRERLRARIWDETTFVEFDQGLSYSIRQIRLALRDRAAAPIFIETLPKQGYRFIAEVTMPANGTRPSGAAENTLSPVVAGNGSDALNQSLPAATVSSPLLPRPKQSAWLIPAAVCAILAVAGLAIYASLHVAQVRLKYVQITDFTDSATSPAVSPDGSMVAFIRGSLPFLSADQIYVKMLPDGEPKRVTNDGRPKYSLAFSPDGSEIAYTVLDPPDWSTYTVSVLGGDSHLLLNNAAGLTWLNQRQLLFSQIRTGLHMGIVTGTATRDHFRELYFPPDERAMAHYSFASPDRRWALVVEMDKKGEWGPCRLISLGGKAQERPIGPKGACTSAGWSPDGSWMYFTATVDGQSHLWRQRSGKAEPEQLTFGPTEEEGVVVSQDGHSIITSMGLHESAIWIHNGENEQSLSSEGEIVNEKCPPSFSADGKVLYYLLRRQPTGSGPELWRMRVDSGTSEAVFPGISMTNYDVSPDGKQVVYSSPRPDGKPQLWLAPIDRSSPAKRIGNSGEMAPHFGSRGQILFESTEANSNYLEQMNQDGSDRKKVVQYPLSDFQSVSPGRRWVIADIPIPNKNLAINVAIPVDGGPVRRICANFCVPRWSANGKLLFVPVEAPTRASPGRSLAIPLGPGEDLPLFPEGGIRPSSEADIVPGSQSVARAELVPGNDISHFAFVNTTVHRNLYRVSVR